MWGGALWHPQHVKWDGDFLRLRDKSPSRTSVCRLFVIANVGQLSSKANITSEARQNIRAHRHTHFGGSPKPLFSH